MVKRLKILFLIDVSGSDRFNFELSRYLEKHYDVESYYICMVPRNIDFLVENGVKRDHIFTAFHLFQKRVKYPDINYLKECEEKYDFRVWDAWNITVTRQNSRYSIPRKKILTWFTYLCRAYENIFDSVKFDAFVLLAAASFSTYVLYKIAMKKDLEIIDLVTSRIPDRFAINNNFEDLWPELVKEYKSIKKKGLNDNELTKVNEYIYNYLNKPKRPDTATVKTVYNKEFFNQVFDIFLHPFRKPGLFDYLGSYWSSFIFKIKGKFLIFSRYFDKPNYRRKYIYIPLHCQPETTTSIYGKWHENQIHMIEVLSKAAPVGYTIYVKEHGYLFSNRPFYFYKEIKKLPNVKLLSPYEDSFDLIKNSSMIATITGSTGWEALFFKKPVLTFGNVFYNVYDNVYNVKDFSKLPLVIHLKLNEKIKDENLIKFMGAMFRASYPGYVNLPGDCGEISLKKENIALISKGVMDYLEKINLVP